MREQHPIRAALAQRRDDDRHLAAAVIEILAEAALLDLGLQVPVRGRDDAHVHLNQLATAQPLDDTLLQEAQQLRLQRQRHVANLIEKQHTAVGGLDLAERLFHRAREGATLIPEQLALQERLGNGGAVDGHPGLRRTLAQGVQRLGETILAARVGIRANQHTSDQAGLKHLRVTMRAQNHLISRAKSYVNLLL